MIISLAFIPFLYFILILIFYVGWRFIPVFNLKTNESCSLSVSIIVACKNESENLLSLISALENQSYKDFELIFVNDHSTDNSNEQLLPILTAFPKSKIIDAEEFGKKNAIKEGILKATGELIVTIDADCIPNVQWIETIIQFQKMYPSDLIICPVKYEDKHSLFSRLQLIEFTSLVASGVGAAGFNMPILCNAANMAFTKKTWLESRRGLHEEILSGDDIFLLESVKKKGGVIKVLKSELAFVTTQSSDSITGFFKQRRRWASKSTAYTDWQIIFTAVIVLFVNLLLMVLLFLSFFYFKYLALFSALFVFKYLVDTLFLNSVKSFFKIKNLWIYSLLLSIIYPLYVVIVGVTALIIKPKSWK